MRITAFLLLIGTLQLSAEGLAQELTLAESNSPLEKVFEKIKKQTGYQFWMEASLLKNARPVSITVKNRPLTEVLDLLFKEQPLTWSIVGKIIIVKDKGPVVNAPPPVVVQDQDTIRGLVIDAKTLEPIVGANVTVKGDKLGVTTNDKGQFVIKMPQGGTLIFTNVGYKQREMMTGKQKFFRIALEVTNESMKDVVITGMFTRKANTYTGSTTTFTKEDLLQVGTVNVLQSLRNLEPSMMVIDNNEYGSDPNTLPDIQIRGATGLPDLKGEYQSNPNLPLFILDGAETTLQKVVDLDINRVRSITMLKDAASKAIYGSRAANGVVVIETERPAAGKLRLSYNAAIGVQAPDLSSYNLTDAREKLDVELAGGVYTGVTNEANYSLMQDYNRRLGMVESGVNTDWLSKPLRNGIGQRHSIRVEGGDAAFRYGLDFMYNNVKGVMKGSDRKTMSGAINLNYRVKNVSINNILTLTDNKGFNSRWGAFSQYAYMNPYLPYYDENGRILKEISNFLLPVAGGATGSLRANPVYNPAYNSSLNMKDQNTYTDITNNLNIDWTILPALRATGRLNFTKQMSESDLFKPADHTDFMSSTYSGANAFRKGSYRKGYGKTVNYTANVLLAYVKRLGRNVITLNGGGEINSRENNSASYTVEGFPNDRLNDVTLALQYLQNSRPAGTENTVRDLSAIISGNYNFDERYLADFSYRRTRSSLLGVNNPWAQLWSAGLGWNLHKESFLKNLNLFDQFRIRASTGYTGSQAFSSYISMATYTYYLDKVYDDANGGYLMGLSNPDLAMQRRQDNNIGVDIGLFKKLNLKLDYYVSNTNGFVTDITLPPSNGFATYKANIGKLQNKGFDIRVDYRMFNKPKTKSFVNVFFNVSHNRNILKELSNTLRSFNNSQDAKGLSTTDKTTSIPRVRFGEGQSVNAIWAVPSLGIDPASGRELYMSQSGEPVFVWNAADQVVAGNSLPDYTGNFGINAGYKGFNLSTTFRFQGGGQIYNQTLVDKVENADIRRNVDRRVLSDRWRKPGDVSFFKDIASTTYTQVSTRFVEDDDKLTMANFSLTYDLDQFKAIKAAGLSRLRVGFNTAELFNLTTVSVERGTAYPFARSYNFTVNASF